MIAAFFVSLPKCGTSKQSRKEVYYSKSIIFFMAKLFSGDLFLGYAFFL